MITRLLKNRKTLIELVIAAVLLALSINLIASSIIELKWIPPGFAFTLALIIVLSCTLYFFSKL